MWLVSELKYDTVKFTLVNYQQTQEVVISGNLINFYPVIEFNPI